MKTPPLPLLLLAACSGGGSDGSDPAQGNGSAAAPKAAGAAIATLTGLYEKQAGDRTNQLCMIPGEGDATRFGLVVWGSNLHSCSGAGTASREGNTLRLVMTGDETCTIEAAIAGDTITLPRSVPDGCSYYCGARATLGGAGFSQTGRTAEEAAKATDLIGEPLCGSGTR